MRIEKDSLGELPVPDQAYYGIQTVRCSNNYDITERTYNDYPEVIRAMAEIKKACARTNAQIGALDFRKAQAIEKTCDEIIAGKFADQFPVRIYRSQGTGVNMNVNEVIANRANEILTGHKGYDAVHPNTHVNMCQSSNDVFPTCEAIIFYRLISRLNERFLAFETLLNEKALEFKDAVRLGRTGLQDAVPNTWGQIFGGWHSMIRRNRLELLDYRSVFQDVVLGGTAIGTGMGQQPGYDEHIYANLSEAAGFPIRKMHCPDEVIPDSAVFDGMRNTDHHMKLAAHVKALATALGRIGCDLMLMSSGPKAGLREITLPKTDIGALGYPGEVTPYVARLMMEIAHTSIGTEQMTTFAADEEQLDHGSVNSGGFIALVDMMELLSDGCVLFGEKCISGIRVNREICRKNAELSGSLSTMVSALFGYPTGVAIAKQALKEGISCKEAAEKDKLLPPDAIEELFDIQKLTDRASTVAMFEKYGKFRKIS